MGRVCPVGLMISTSIMSPALAGGIGAARRPNVIQMKGRTFQAIGPDVF
jgi:hypothetical protein